MKSWEETEEEGSVLWHAPARKGRGRCPLDCCCLLSPLLQPGAMEAAPGGAADRANADSRGSRAALQSLQCLGKHR